MGLSTHVLDTMHGCPASGMAVKLYTTTLDSLQATLVKTVILNADGRNPDGLLLDASGRDLLSRSRWALLGVDRDVTWRAAARTRRGVVE